MESSESSLQLSFLVAAGQQFRDVPLVELLCNCSSDDGICCSYLNFIEDRIMGLMLPFHVQVERLGNVHDTERN